MRRRTRTVSRLSPNFADTDPDDYPMPMVTYVTAPTSKVYEGRGITLRSFLTYAVGDAQTTLPDGYFPLSDAMKQQTQDAISKIPTSTAPAPGSGGTPYPTGNQPRPGDDATRRNDPGLPDRRHRPGRQRARQHGTACYDRLHRGSKSADCTSAPAPDLPVGVLQIEPARLVLPGVAALSALGLLGGLALLGAARRRRIASPASEVAAMSTVDRPMTDVDHAFRQIVVGIDVLEGRMARAPEQRGTDDDLLLTSLAFSLERLAQGDGPVDRRPGAACGAGAGRRAHPRGDRRAGSARGAIVGAPVVDAPSAEELEADAELVAVPPPEPRWTAGRIRRICGLALLGMGVVLALFLVYEFAFTGFRESRSQRALLPVFEQRLATGTFGDPTAPVPNGPVALLQIASIGMHQIVVQGSSPSDLKQGPGHMPGSPLPGEFGNSVILGHNRLYGGPFGGIDSLHKGDTIIAVTGQGRFRYDVEKVVTVAPGDKDVIGAALESRMTLVTSESPTSSDRVAVIAKLHGDPVAVPQRPQAFAGSDQRGRAATPPACCWRSSGRRCSRRRSPSPCACTSSGRAPQLIW